MMPHDFNHRLSHLELVWPKPSCPVCLGKPSRVVTIDPVTDEVINESMPATGCPVCGKGVFREYLIVVDDDAA